MRNIHYLLWDMQKKNGENKEDKKTEDETKLNCTILKVLKRDVDNVPQSWHCAYVLRQWTTCGVLYHDPAHNQLQRHSRQSLVIACASDGGVSLVQLRHHAVYCRSQQVVVT